MSPYRQEVFAEMFGWINQYPQLGEVALTLAVSLFVGVVVYEIVDQVRSRGGDRAD